MLLVVEDFMEGLNKYLKKKVSGDTDYYGNGIHCSSLDGCVRKVVYDYYNMPKRERTVSELIQLQVGNLCHDMIQEAILHNNKFDVLGVEADVSEGLPENVSGKLDIILRHKNTGEISLWDIKSVRPNAFKYGDLIKQSYKIQVNAYKVGWETIYQKTIDKMYIIVIDRSGTNSPYIEEVKPMDIGELNTIFKKYREAVERYKVAEELPPMIDYDVKLKTAKGLGTAIVVNSNWECNYCQFREITCPRKQYKDYIAGEITSDGRVIINDSELIDEINNKVKQLIER